MKLSHRRPETVNRVAELTAITAVGSGDWLGISDNKTDIK
jgi:hypothetical protein